MDEDTDTDYGYKESAIPVSLNHAGIDHYRRRPEFSDKDQMPDIKDNSIKDLYTEIFGNSAEVQKQYGRLRPYLQALKPIHVLRHSWRVGILSAGFARFTGHSDSDVRKIALKGILHDIGKGAYILVGGKLVYKYADILNSPHCLTPRQRELIDGHSADSADILARVGLPDEYIRTAATHHSHTDLDTHTRIVAISDMFESTYVAHRPYNKNSASPERRGKFYEALTGRFPDDPLAFQFRQWEALHLPGITNIKL